MNKVLSFSVDNYSKNDGDYNTAIGNLMADAVLELTNPVFKNKTEKNIDMVLLNHGGIRSILPKGKVTTKTAYKLMPFENSVVVTALKGSVVFEMINYLKISNKAHPISGLELVINADNSYKKIPFGLLLCTGNHWWLCNIIFLSRQLYRQYEFFYSYYQH